MTAEPTPTAHAPRLSVAMIVRDEASRIGRALDSVQAIADEIIVVDTGSQDETVALASAAGARVLQVTWGDDFAAARNASLDACQGQWILVLDADEALWPGSVETLRAVVAIQPERPTACEIVIRNWTSPDIGTGFDHRAVRLFSRHPHLRFAGRIHEQLTHQELGETGIDWRLAPDILIEHWGYQPAARQAKGTSERNRHLLEQTVADHPDDPATHHHLGMWYWAEQRPHEALAAFEKALALATGLPAEPAYLITSRILQVASHVVLGQYPQALDAAKTAEDCCGGEPDYWFNVGLAHQGLADHEATLATFQRCLELRGTQPYMAEHGTRGWKALLAMANSYEALGDRTAAMARRWQALQDFPFQPVLHARLWAQAWLDDDRASQAEANRLWQTLPPEMRVQVAAMCLETIESLDAWPLAEGIAREFLLVLPLTHAGDMILRYAALLHRRGALPDGLEQRLSTLDGICRPLADHLKAVGDWAGFLRVCRVALAESIDVVYLGASLGSALLQAGETEAAAEVLQMAADQGATDANVWNNLGVIALQRKAVEEATAHFHKAVALQPAHVAANLNLIRTAWWRQDMEQATLRLGAVMQALERLIQAPVGNQLDAAMQDLAALYGYFREWDQRRRQDPTIVSPPGVDAFLQTLHVIWHLVGARLKARC
jgi:tetratricopeptide (TPR) repeat protein